MTAQLYISFKNMTHSRWVDELIRQEALKIEHFCDSIMSCRVIARVPHKHHRFDNDFEISLNIHVPHHEIVVNNKSTHGMEPVSVVTRAFETATRQLDEHMRISRGRVKQHRRRHRNQPPQRQPASVFPGYVQQEQQAQSLSPVGFIGYRGHGSLEA